MSDPDLDGLVAAARNLIRPHLERSEDARRLCRELGRWLLQETERAERVESDSTGDDGAAPGAHVVEMPDGASEQPAADLDQKRALVPLNIAGAVAQVEVSGDTEAISRARKSGGALEQAERASDDDAPTDIDLALIVRRSRLKAESCRLSIQRREVKYDHERERPILEQMNRMIEIARAMQGCFLWAFLPEREPPGDEDLRVIAACYDALADAADLTQFVDALGVDAPEGAVQTAFELLAEANSALRIALEPTWLDRADADQDEAHQWLAHETKRRELFIPRHMRLDDPADPAQTESVRRRVGELQAEVYRAAKEASRLREQFNKVKYHAYRVARDGEAFEHHDMDRIVETIEILCEAGVVTSNLRFGEALPPSVARRLLENPSRAVQEVAEHIVHRASQAAQTKQAPSRDEPRWSETVLQARDLLSGGVMVIVGGEPRTKAIERLENAFALDRVEWAELKEHGPAEPMKPLIQRPETRCVLVLVKLCGHQHAETADAWAKEAGKPCVNITAGYNPEQVAHSVLEQASKRLSEPKSSV